MHTHPGYLLLFILAAACFFLATINPRPVKPYQINIGFLGLLLWLLAPLLILAQN